MDYGTDLRLDDERDVIFTPDGDAELQDGVRLVAQDVREELSIVFGSVEWDRATGSYLTDNLNAATDPDSMVMGELERIALKDPRVDASSVSVKRLGEGRYSLFFRAVGSIDPVQLLFDLEDLLGGE